MAGAGGQGRDIPRVFIKTSVAWLHPRTRSLKVPPITQQAMPPMQVPSVYRPHAPNTATFPQAPPSQDSPLAHSPTKGPAPQQATLCPGPAPTCSTLHSFSTEPLKRFMQSSAKCRCVAYCGAMGGGVRVRETESRRRQGSRGAQERGVQVPFLRSPCSAPSGTAASFSGCGTGL